MRAIAGIFIPNLLSGIKFGSEKAITRLAAAIKNYTDKDKNQGDQQTLAAGTLESVASDMVLFAQKRRAIQLAADQAWPWRTPGVATIRKALLPTDHPLTD